jgi:O-antigen/teichoic acid export membrane protein
MQFRQIILNSIFWRGLYFFTVTLLNVVLAQFFGSANTGWIYYLTSFFSFIILIGSLSLESGMGYFSAQKKIGEQSLAFLSFSWTVLIVILSTAYLYFFYDLQVGAVSTKRLILFASTYISGLLLTNFFSALFYAQQNYFLPNVILTICQLGLVMTGMLLYFLTDRMQYAVVFLDAYFACFLLQGLLLAFFYCWKNKVYLRWSMPSFTELTLLFRYSLFALLANGIFFLLYRIDYWFIKHTCVAYPPELLNNYLGNYIQVSKIGQVFLVLPAILASAVFPVTAAGFKKEVNLRLPVLIKSLVIIYLIIVLILAAIGKWFFPWLYGPSFNYMYFPFLLLMPGIVSLAIISLLSAYNSGNNRIHINIIGATIGLAVIIAGDWLFIPKYGIPAAALVSTAGYMSYLLFLLFVFKKEHSILLGNMLIPQKEDWKTLVNLISASWK